MSATNIRWDQGIGEAVRLAIKKRYHTGRALAEASELSASTITRIAKGGRGFDTIGLAHWCNLYPCIMDFLPPDAKYHRWAKLQPQRGAHPCAGRPDWLREMCLHWDSMPSVAHELIRLAASEGVRLARLEQHASRRHAAG
jgi:transcriptional regulator with XRE-family HTH domain